MDAERTGGERARFKARRTNGPVQQVHLAQLRAGYREPPAAGLTRYIAEGEIERLILQSGVYQLR